MNPIRLMLVDDHAVVRAGYRFLLDNDPDFRVVAEASSGEEALRLCETARPDVMILDLSMPGLGGMETIRRLAARHSPVKVLVFSMHENLAFVEQALQAGVSGYISKNSEPEELVSALRKVAAGGSYVDAELAQRLVLQRSREQGSPFAVLSPREFQILCRFAEARSLAQIAAELCLSSKTVANYLSQIKDKLQVGSSTELVRLAISQGLVSL